MSDIPEFHPIHKIQTQYDLKHALIESRYMYDMEIFDFKTHDDYCTITYYTIVPTPIEDAIRYNLSSITFKVKFNSIINMINSGEDVHFSLAVCNDNYLMEQFTTEARLIPTHSVQYKTIFNKIKG